MSEEEKEFDTGRSPAKVSKALVQKAGESPDAYRVRLTKEFGFQQKPEDADDKMRPVTRSPQPITVDGEEEKEK